MKIELILGIVSGICLILGGLSYLVYYEHREERKYIKFGICSIILAALGIGLLVGITNKHNSEIEENSEEYIEECGEEIDEINYNEGELDP